MREMREGVGNLICSPFSLTKATFVHEKEEEGCRPLPPSSLRSGWQQSLGLNSASLRTKECTSP